MKKIIAAGLMTGMAIAGLSVGAGTANARPYCETGGYGPAQGLCIGGPYGPVAVRRPPDVVYPTAPDPTRAAILGDGETPQFSSVQQFGVAYSKQICSELQASPQRDTIWAEVSVWQTQTNLRYSQLQQGIGYAIDTYCPEYRDIYSADRSYYP